MASNDMDDDLSQLAQQFQSASDNGSFDPFAMLQGATHFHSVFLAPFSPTMRQAMEQFAKTGDGPLASLVEQFQRGGLSAAEANSKVREILAAAKGMLVVILSNDQGLNTIPQLFFGHFSPAYLEQAVQLCSEAFPDRQALQQALSTLASAHHHGAQGPHCYASQSNADHATHYWAELAGKLDETLNQGLLANQAERLMDLAYWISASFEQLGEDQLAGEELCSLAKIRLYGGELKAATGSLGNLLSHYEPEDEELLNLIELLTSAAIRHGDPLCVVDFLAQFANDIDPLLGGTYELALLRFRALVAAQAELPELSKQVAALQKADRKSFRHDLNREPLWQVTIADPGPTLSVNEAATFLDRSIHFVAKRLEAGTIPFVVQEGERLVPSQALSTWKALSEEYRLID